MHQHIKRNKILILSIIIIIAFGLISGIIYYYLKDINTQNTIINTLKNSDSFHYNFILKDLIIMSILFVSSFFILGVPLAALYLFYESFVIGFLINIFFITFNISGLIYIFIFIVINKIITFIIKIIYLKFITNVSRYLIGFFIYKKDNELKNKIFINAEKALLLILIIFIINIFLYFLSPIILKKLVFLL